MLKIFPVKTDGDIEKARKLFVEYHDFLGFDLGFENYNEELANLPGEYAPPAGCILLATYEQELIGCTAIKQLDDGVCEMRRLFIRPQFQGRGMGRTLAEAGIEHARKLGYHFMRLDTVMDIAKKL
ncbi:MAG: GNAT family N-acetyltransferase [Planctomycetota bacterium]|jgi:GNAT superfamily N-acetyltransferase